PDPQAAEAQWDELFKHKRRQQERLQRAFEERRSRGEEDEQAFEKALDDLGPEAPGEDAAPADETWRDEQEPLAGAPDDETVPEGVDSGDGAEDEAFDIDDKRHPLLKRAMEFLKHLHTAFRDA